MGADDVMQCNAIKRKTWLGNHLTSKHNKQAEKAKGLVLQHESSFSLFSLKSFLQEVLLTYLKEAKQDIKQERAIRTIYSTNKLQKPFY